VSLFQGATGGIVRLMETYKHCSILTLCLKHYWVLITSHLKQCFAPFMFQTDDMSAMYTSDTVMALHHQWSASQIKVVLDLNAYVSQSTDTIEGTVHALDNIIQSADVNTQRIMMTH
jgi:hypothetical protein